MQQQKQRYQQQSEHITPEQEKKREMIFAAIKEHGEQYAIAAMIDGSIGYHTPTDAKILINDIKEGRVYDACERCLCCYGGNLLGMVSNDIKMFELMSPGRRDRVVEAVKRFDKLTPIQEMTMGLMYPTAGI